MSTQLNPLLRIGIFYDGQYFFNVSNYYAYQHERRARISVEGLHNFIRKQVAEVTKVDVNLCQIVDAHYFRGRLSARDANSQNKLYHERVFDDILMGENIVSHYLPLRKSNDGSRQEKGIDVWLALEAYELAIYKRFDVIALIACDGDYVPLVRKLNTLGTRVMLLSWDFKYKDENGNDRETKTSQPLLDEVTYPVPMHQLIDDPKKKNDIFIQNMFVVPPEENNRNMIINRPCKATSHTIQAPKVIEEIRQTSEILSLYNGYGFIKLPPDNIFFHYTNLENIDFNDLKIGAKVTYTTKVATDGKTQADKVWVVRDGKER